ncbi:glycosyltransferase [Bacillus coahuilensis]|uniref:glycosyltransferase n=1 Tax=Bacillus coahuilensis TaxID=408580 RepID=UPI003B43AC53
MYVGRLAAEKEIHKIKRLLEKQDNIVLVIVGDGPERNDLEKLFQHESVVFTGFLHGEELAIAYASSDAFYFSIHNRNIRTRYIRSHGIWNPSYCC